MPKAEDINAALDAFTQDHKIEGRGVAIRILVTNALSHLGYLPFTPEEDIWGGDQEPAKSKEA